MKQYTSDIAFTESVKAIQTRHGSRHSYARVEKDWWPDRITAELPRFISVWLAFKINHCETLF